MDKGKLPALGELLLVSKKLLGIVQDFELVNLQVDNPEACPWPLTLRKCPSCSGEFVVNDLKLLRRLQVHATVCQRHSAEARKEIQLLMLQRACGLVGWEFSHIFDAAIADNYNMIALYEAKKWDYTAGRGLYIMPVYSEDNPTGNGTGKSFLMHCLVNALCQDGVQCLFVRVSDLLMQIRSSYQHEEEAITEDALISKYSNIPVLFLDDMGKESIKRGNEWAPEKLYQIIDYRQRCNLPMVISSNYSLDQLEQRMGENHGYAIVSRLAGSCDIISLGGPDRRWQQ